MILGVGTDILNCDRINKILKKYECQFLHRILGKNELLALNKRRNLTELFLAKRFAAKEASSKRGEGIFFKETEILNDKDGKPYLHFSGKTKNYIDNKEKKINGKLKFDISLSDDPPYVIAFVVISLAPVNKVMHKI